MTSTPRLTLRSPIDLLATVPYLLGFHPRDSVVAIGLRGANVIFQARADLPGRGVSRQQVHAEAEYLATVVRRQEVSSAMIVGYGPADQVTPSVLALTRLLIDSDIEVAEAIRVTGDRFWSYVCADLTCCPAEGTAVDISSSRIAAEATFAGLVALADRAALVARLATVVGLARQQADEAIMAAHQRLATLCASMSRSDLDRAVRTAFVAAFAPALVLAGGGGQIADDQIAWLNVLLEHRATRALAWDRIRQATPAGLSQLNALWSELVRRADVDLVAAPATLLAYTAWRLGDGAVAQVALDRAITADPAYPLALVVRGAIADGTPPSALDSLSGAFLTTQSLTRATLV